MRYVYLLRSGSSPTETYVGITAELKTRLRQYNAGNSPHTCKFRPWECVVAVGFQEDRRAEAFERYLKSGSGRAFARRHFW
ncbi:MAG: excinuclease ABC subunit C [Phycisphaerae bacterium SM23_33]|nr:MAG: excinuclease ABC subunit C [Phycisphaerae bacterium SM23_33]